MLRHIFLAFTLAERFFIVFGCFLATTLVFFTFLPPKSVPGPALRSLFWASFGKGVRDPLSELIWETFGEPLGALGSALGPLGELRDALGETLGVPWNALGTLWDPLGTPLGSSGGYV